MIFSCLHDAIDQRAFDLHAGDVLEMQNAALRVTTFLAKIEFLHAVLGEAQVEVHTHLAEFGNTSRTFGDHGANGLLVTKTRPGDQRVANVQVEGILLAHHTGHTSLSPGGIRVTQLALGDDCDRAMGGGLQGKRKPCNSTAKHDKVEFSHDFLGELRYCRSIVPCPEKPLRRAGPVGADWPLVGAFPHPPVQRNRVRPPGIFAIFVRAARRILDGVARFAASFIACWIPGATARSSGVR